MKIDDVVILNIDVPEKGLISGKHGFIVAVHETASEFLYEVGFLDFKGDVCVQIPLKSGQFRILWSS